jgi:hypothetical protein
LTVLWQSGLPLAQAMLLNLNGTMKNRIFALLCAVSFAADPQAIELNYTPGQLLNDHEDTLLIRYDPSAGWSHFSTGGRSSFYQLDFDYATAGLVDGQTVPLHLRLQAELTGVVDKIFMDNFGLEAEAANFLRVNSARVETTMGGTRLVTAQLPPAPNFGSTVFEFDLITVGTVWANSLNVAASVTTHPLFIPESVDLVDAFKPAAFEARTSAIFRIVSAEADSRVNGNGTRVPDGGVTGVLLLASLGGILLFRHWAK